MREDEESLQVSARGNRLLSFLRHFPRAAAAQAATARNCAVEILSSFFQNLFIAQSLNEWISGGDFSRTDANEEKLPPRSPLNPNSHKLRILCGVAQWNFCPF